MSKMIYKIYEPEDYAVRYTADLREAYAKVKDGEEFKTNFAKNNTGYEATLAGKEVSKEVYEDY